LSPRWSNLSADDMVRKLIARGFEKTDQKGSHARYDRSDGAFADVPMHKGRNLSRGVIRNIMKTARLTKEKLEK